MADEAVIRIVLEGEGGSGQVSTPSTPSPSAPSPSTSSSGSGSPRAPIKPNPPPDPTAFFDPRRYDQSGVINKRAEAERKRLETQKLRDEKKAEVDKRKTERERDRDISKTEKDRDRSIAKINRDQERRRKRIEKEIQRANKQQDAERKRIEQESDKGSNKVLQDAERNRSKGEIEKRKRMRERLRARKSERLQQQREVAKLERERKRSEPKPPFDPSEVAKKRREGERRSAQVDEAYKKEYGDEEQHKGPLDLIFARISTLRGTLGGLLGTTLGASLDVFHVLRREQAEYQKREKRKALLREADNVEAEKYGAAADRYGNDPSSSERVGNKATAFNLVKSGLDIAGKFNKSKQQPLPGADSLGKAADTGKLDRGEDPTAALSGIAGAIASFGGYVPVIGAAVVAIGASVAVISTLLNSVDKMAENYGQYNPMVAQAQAMGEMRKIMGDMRRAQEIGPQLAEYIQAQTDMQQKFEDIKVKIYSKIVPLLTSMYTAMGFMLGIMDDNKNAQIEDPTEIILRKANESKIGSTTELDLKQDIITGL